MRPHPTKSPTYKKERPEEAAVKVIQSWGWGTGSNPSRPQLNWAASAQGSGFKDTKDAGVKRL